MKRMIFAAVAVAVLLSCFGACASEDTATSSSKSSSDKKGSSSQTSAAVDASSESLSSELASSEPTSSELASSEPSSKYLDIDAEVKRLGLSVDADVSACFKNDAEGYIINGGTYKVDAETLVRLTKVHVEGNGSVKWKDHNTMGGTTGNTDLFDGVVPVSKLKDPVFMSTALPSELETYMSYRVNATNMYPAETKYRRLVSIGAIYKENNTVLPDDAEITICLGRIVLLARTEEKGWFIADDKVHPDAPKKIFYLPWSLEHTLGTSTIPSDRIKTYSDHVEIKMTGAMLNGTYNVPDNYKDKVEGSVLHFWGKNWTFTDGSKVQGCVAGFTAWIKESEYVGKVGVAVGADWRVSAGGSTSQAFSGMNYILTTEPRMMFGHNVGPKAYDTIMDTDKVQQLLGLK